jgi:hypothetical protein
MKLFGGPALAAKRGKLGTTLVVMASLAASMAVSVPAQAAGSMSGAEKLRRLDIMLMVTGLRCRKTADNFNAEYGKFTTSHMPTLNAANAELRANMARKFGPAAANRQLDRLSTTMANAYGNGHPWLSCGELKQVARDLAKVRGRETLVEAADQLLDDRASSQMAFARR